MHDYNKSITVFHFSFIQKYFDASSSVHESVDFRSPDTNLKRKFTSMSNLIIKNLSDDIY